MRAPKHAGFTLIEILIAVAIALTYTAWLAKRLLSRADAAHEGDGRDSGLPRGFERVRSRFPTTSITTSGAVPAGIFPFIPTGCTGTGDGASTTAAAS